MKYWIQCVWAWFLWKAFRIDRLPDGEGALIRRGWPPALAKSAFDNGFNYACRVAGVTYYFTGCEDIGNGWVTLMPLGSMDADHIEVFDKGKQPFKPSGPPCPRGIDVRVSDIVWCADAPYGS